MREADAAALEEASVLDDPRQTAAAERAAGRLLPQVGAEGLAVKRFEALDDAPLQAEQVLADGLGVDEVSHFFRWRPMNSSTDSYQATMLRGFRIQWFSSGKTSSSLGTPWYCSASNRFSPSLIGQR